MTRPITIGSRRIGPGYPLYFIAEAGSNHDRKLDQAHRLIDVAADAGADAVKFQTFRADKLYPRNAGITKYLAVPKSIHEIIRELEMPFEWIPELAAHCAERKIDFLSTPFDEESADALDPYVSAFKIASYEMTHHTLVQHCARKGKPLIVSTGTATLDEVREVVAAVRLFTEDLIVLQCTAKYPAPLSVLNLRTIPLFTQELGVVAGLSDHSREPLPGPLAATALGASVIEKHFTLRNDLPGPDHAYALEPHELADVIAKLRDVEKSLGTGIKAPPPEEQELRHFARRSLFTWKDVADGAVLTVDNLAVLRCGELPYGIHPRELIRVLGRPVRHAMPAGTSLRTEDVGDLLMTDGAVTLRPLAKTDTDSILKWRTRPDVIRELFSDGPPTREQHEAWFEQLSRRTDRLEYVIEHAQTPVGTIGLANIDFGAHTAEYGILIGEDSARGAGVARTASKLILRFAAEVLGLKSVYLTMFADNEAARRLYDALGFVVDAELPARKERAVQRMSLRLEGVRP